MVYIMSFLVPSIIWVISIAISGIFPFGTNTMLTSDMAYQYVGYFEFVQRILNEGISVAFSFSKGMGEETLGMLAYYMMSPFNLILKLFRAENITEAILTINLLKIGMCGFTFSLFIKKQFKSINRFMTVAFSTCYALMAYNIAYQFNIMWLDAVVWLPIIILGVDRLIEKNKSDLFFLSLTVSIISNWYIGFMLCVFSTFWFVYRMTSTGFSKKSLKKFVTFGILAAGSALIVIVPAFFTCMSEVKRNNLFDSSTINYTVIDIFSKFIIGAFDFWQITDKSITPDCLNLPNLFAGVTVFMLFVVYFFNKSFEKKERIKDGIFFSVLLATTLFAPLNRMWHVFTYNIWFPYRYSFCITFYMIYIAYKSLSGIKGIELKKIFYIVLSIIIGCFIIEKQNYTYIKSEFIYCTVFMLIAAFIAVKIIKKKDKRAFGVLALVMCIEVFANTAIYMLNFDFFNRNDFYAKRDFMQKEIAKITKEDKGYYRIENNVINDYNANMGQRLLGITSSSTMGKESARGLLESLGYTRVVCNSVIYSPVTKFADSFLGVKYYISENAEKNEDALALGFLVEDTVMSVKDFTTPWTKHSNSFEKMNELSRSITNMEEKIYNKIDIYGTKTENLIENGEKNTYIKQYPYSKALYSFSFTANTEDDIYLKVDGNSVKNAKIYINSKELTEYMTAQKYSTIKLGSFKKGENVDVDIEFISADKIMINNIWVYSENSDSLQEIIKVLKKSQLEIESMTDSELVGKINVEDTGKVLLFTIPYDKNLRVIVDGKDANVECVLDSLIAVKLVTGEHTVKVEYSPKYLVKIGVASGIFFVLGIFFIMLERRKEVKNA